MARAVLATNSIRAWPLLLTGCLGFHQHRRAFETVAAGQRRHEAFRFAAAAATAEQGMR